eukprot:13342698-Alexandrium_andersonii.AAC.1
MLLALVVLRLFRLLLLWLFAILLLILLLRLLLRIRVIALALASVRVVLIVSGGVHARADALVRVGVLAVVTASVWIAACGLQFAASRGVS